jgi:opacity protein-like surface antigen
MKFFMQIGLGYGRINGDIKEGDGNEVKFAGGAFGTILGMGAQFCFYPEHCISLEGDYRYLTIDRFIVTDSSGTTGLSQQTKDMEVELNNADVSARLGGLVFMFGYAYWF